MAAYQRRNGGKLKMIMAAVMVIIGGVAAASNHGIFRSVYKRSISIEKRVYGGHGNGVAAAAAAGIIMAKQRRASAAKIWHQWHGSGGGV